MRLDIRSRWLCAISVVIAWLAGGPRDCPGQESLAWKFRPQDRYRIVTSQDVAMIARVDDKSVRLGHHTAVQVAWQVTDVDASGVADIAQSVERMKVRLQSPAADDVVYDTADDEPARGAAKPLAAAVDPLLKTGAKMKISPTASVTNVRLSNNDQTLTRPGTDAAEAFARFFSETGVVELIGLTQLALPEQPVSVGDHWGCAENPHTGLGPFVRTTSFERVDDETRDNRKLAKISLRWTLKPTTRTKPRLPGEPEPAAVPRIDQQNNRGTILFDAAAGHPVEAVFQHRMNITAVSGEQEIQQEVASDVKVRITKLLAERSPASDG